MLRLFATACSFQCYERNQRQNDIGEQVSLQDVEADVGKLCTTEKKGSLSRGSMDLSDSDRITNAKDNVSTMSSQAMPGYRYR